ncbi:hypothetical protein [Glycomyces sp. NRRL B-16210]|uniref:hypothetical protein n=1 Tax=Glycomyces sp. NRRL B-16210 TaxID=1463821 RepID=UPI00105C53E8|nr:hypothetical protein [Glycomyces sp. NRRL B-16210]
MDTRDVRVHVVGELRDEIDVRSIAATLVDAALAIADREDEANSSQAAGRTDDNDRKAAES